MKKNNSPKDILDKIKISKRILISLHDGPDGDSLGSCAAMKYFLERDLKIKVDLISRDKLKDSFRLFDFYKEVKEGKRIDGVNLSQYDIIIFMDFGDLKYYSEKDKLDIKGKFVINIDHHETNTYFGDLNYVDKTRPSDCSILLDLFRGWKIKFDKELSTRLLLGVYTDSDLFSLSKDALEDAVFLNKNGADYLKIVNIIKYSVPLKIKKYFSLLIDNFRVENFEEYIVGVCGVSKKQVEDLGLNLSEARSAPNYLQEIGGLDFLFVLTEMSDFLKGSFRSRKNINVSLFAKELGGGGHALAAAFYLPLMSIKEAEKRVFDAIKKVGIHKINC